MHSISGIWCLLCCLLCCSRLLHWHCCLLLPSMYYCSLICSGRSGKHAWRKYCILRKYCFRNASLVCERTVQLHIQGFSFKQQTWTLILIDLTNQALGPNFLLLSLFCIKIKWLKIVEKWMQQNNSFSTSWLYTNELKKWIISKTNLWLIK